MISEILLHCADLDTEWWYDPHDMRPGAANWKSSPLDPYLDFEHPWFEHHEYSRTARYTEIDSMRILMRGHMEIPSYPSRINWTPIE